MGIIIKHDFKNDKVKDLGTLDFGNIMNTIDSCLMASIYYKTEAQTQISITCYDKTDKDFITYIMNFK